MSLRSLIGGFVQVPKAGLSTAQVQALIVGEVGVTISRGGYATSVADGDTTTLTVASKRIQRVSGSDVQDFELPLASTLYLGFDFLFINRSTQAITLKSSGGNSVLVVPGGASAFAVCALTSGTSAASWAAEQISDYATLESPAFTGNPTAPTPTEGDASTKLATTAYVYEATLNAINAALSSGTYAPTISNLDNLDSASAVSSAQWLRVGSIVTVSGQIGLGTFDTPGAVTSFDMTLPVTTAFTNTYEAGGTCASKSVAGHVAAIQAIAAGDKVRFEWISVGAANQTMFYSFTYRILEP